MFNILVLTLSASVTSFAKNFHHQSDSSPTSTQLNPHMYSTFPMHFTVKLSSDQKFFLMLSHISSRATFSTVSITSTSCSTNAPTWILPDIF